MAYSCTMPTGRHDNLQKLYDRQKLLAEEAARLESERDSHDPDSDRYYLLELQITALREEASRLSSLTADILERDLQR
jgi:hypothetical protein